MLLALLSDLVKIDDILIIIRNDCAISEIRSNSLCTRQKEKWITIGDNDGPAHMHINSEQIESAEFVQKVMPERTSFSVRFYDSDGERVMAAFFTKMYDKSRTLISERKKIYDELSQRYPSKIRF